MALTEKNVQDMQAVGTVLIEFLPAEDGVDWSDRPYFRENAGDQRKFVRKGARNLKPGQGIYGLVSKCGFLEETADGASICSVSDDPDIRPGVCYEFRPGSRTCLKTREKVVTIMRQEDDLLPDLVGVALGQTALHAS